MLNFTRPDFAQHPIVVRASGEVRMSGIPQGVASDNATEANIVNMGLGDVIQLVNADSDQPLDPQVYIWQWQERVSNEADWTLLRKTQSESRPVWFIPYTVEYESWLVDSASATKTLSRPTADSKSAALFNGTTYTSQAWLEDVEQTVITTGTPTSGQTLVSGSTVQVAGATIGDMLTVAYYPAYPVRIARIPRNYGAYNREDAQILAVETRLQVPS